MFLKENMVNKKLVIDVNKSLTFLHKLKKRFTYPRNNTLLRTLRMTIVENK